MKKSSFLLAWVFGLMVSGCTSGAAGGSAPPGNAPPGQADQLVSANQIIIKFKPTFAALAQANCLAAYLTLAGAQKGYVAVIKSVLFSGAHVVEVLPSGQIKSDKSAANSPVDAAKTSLSRGEALAFISYLGQQTAVDYVELDTKQQTMATTASAPLPALNAKSGLSALATVSVLTARITFRQTCGDGLAEPRSAQ